MTDERKQRIRNMHRITFTVGNFSGVKVTDTGWLIEPVGWNFWRVWSDSRQQYVAVHESQMGWKR